MEKKSIHCTLTDHELVAKADQWIDELIASGGKSFTMQVPARPNADTDLIFAELNNRFKKLIGQQRPAWVKASDRLPGVRAEVKWRIDGVEWETKETPLGMWYNKPNNFHKYEWLDEAAPSGEISQDAHEKEVMMEAFDRVRKIFELRSWIMEGRGSYPYNDDRYKEEVRYLYDEFEAIRKDTWANIKSKTFEYRKLIIDQYLKEHPSGEREAAFAEWILKEGYEPVPGNMWADYRIEGPNNRFTTAQLYKLFKQNRNNENS